VTFSASMDSNVSSLLQTLLDFFLGIELTFELTCA
jgi:hypothetical protein